MSESTAHATGLAEHIAVLRGLAAVTVDTCDDVLQLLDAMAGDPLAEHLAIEPEWRDAREVFVIRVRMSVGDAARLRGFINYDTALPQPWVTQVRLATGEDPVGQMVWSYDPIQVPGASETRPNPFGVPAAVTPCGEAILTRWEQVLGS